jgi:hypothetical protein
MSMGWKGQGQSGFKGQRGSGKSSRDGAWGKVIPNPKLKLMDQVREVMRLKHYSIRTERCYCDWIRRYIRFHSAPPMRRDGARRSKYCWFMAPRRSRFRTGGFP